MGQYHPQLKLLNNILASPSDASLSQAFISHHTPRKATARARTCDLVILILVSLSLMEAAAAETRQPLHDYWGLSTEASKPNQSSSSLSLHKPIPIYPKPIPSEFFSSMTDESRSSNP
jgi:hypothetical protein